MNYTSVEQSKKLLELGLSPESADMAWIDRPSRVTDCPEVPVIMDIELESMIPQDKLIPCWSVGALLDAFPIAYNGITPMRPHIWRQTSEEYCATYKNNTGDYCTLSYATTALDALYKTILWHIEHNYIKQ